MQDQLYRQQSDDAEGHCPAGQQHAKEVEATGPDHGEMRRQRVGVDHGGHGVGGIVEAVDELEAQGNQQGYAQEQEGCPGGDDSAELVHVVQQAVGGEQQTDSQHCKEEDSGKNARFAFQLWPAVAGGGRSSQ